MDIRERMKSGKLYDPGDSEIMAEQAQWLEVLYDFNQTRPSQMERRQELMKKLFAQVGKNCYIEPPLHANWGKNTHLGDGVYANFNLTLVDDTDIYIGTGTDPDGHELILFIPKDKLTTFLRDNDLKTESLGKVIYDLIGDELKKKKNKLGKAASLPTLTRYLGFIRTQFIRDAQFYNGESFSDDIDMYDEEHEDNWTDINGPVMVFDAKASSEEEVIERLKSLYSCSENEFLVIKVGSCVDSPEKAVTRYHYETGRVETEVLGSGSSFFFVRTTVDEAEAFRLYRDPRRNYLLRWHMEDELKITDTWDRNSQSWLPASITREKGVQK